MADIGFVLLLTGFFALCLAFVRACERVIGPDPDAVPAAVETAAPADRSHEAAST